jgi:hypothetical protein
VYQADITLTAKEGFSFDPVIPFSYPVNAVDAQSTDNAVDVRRLSIVYKITAVPLSIPPEDTDLTGYIPTPVMGATALTGFYAGTYGGMISWKTAAGEAGEATASGLFQGGTVYTAELTLYPGPGYTLAGSTFTYAGEGTINP